MAPATMSRVCSASSHALRACATIASWRSGSIMATAPPVIGAGTRYTELNGCPLDRRVYDAVQRVCDIHDPQRQGVCDHSIGRQRWDVGRQRWDEIEVPSGAPVRVTTLRGE